MYRRKGYTLEAIAERIAAHYNVAPEDILSKGRRKDVVEARDVLCHIAVHTLGITITEAARRIGMAPSAIS